MSQFDFRAKNRQNCTSMSIELQISLRFDDFFRMRLFDGFFNIVI